MKKCNAAKKARHHKYAHLYTVCSDAEIAQFTNKSQINHQRKLHIILRRNNNINKFDKFINF